MASNGTRGLVCASVVLMLGLIACGDDDDDGAPLDGGADSGMGMSGKGGSGGSGGSAGSRAGSGGSMSTAGTGGTGFMPASCDPAIPTTATCGGMACPAPSSPIASFVCSVPCCLPDDTCGTRRAYMDNPTDCAPPATPDPSCPGRTVMGMGSMGMDGGMGGMTLAGCCAPSGYCGVISSADMSCITMSPLIADLMPGAPCGEMEMDGGQEDGGN